MCGRAVPQIGTIPRSSVRTKVAFGPVVADERARHNCRSALARRRWIGQSVPVTEHRPNPISIHGAIESLTFLPIERPWSERRENQALSVNSASTETAASSSDIGPGRANGSATPSVTRSSWSSTVPRRSSSFRTTARSRRASPLGRSSSSPRAHGTGSRRQSS